MKKDELKHIKKSSTGCSHLIIFVANTCCSDPFVCHSLTKLIANHKFIKNIPRYTLVDLTDTTWLTRLRSEVNSIQYAVLFLWDSHHPVPPQSIDVFHQFLATTVSHVVPVFFWVLVNAELFQHRKKRKLALNRLKTVCRSLIFQSFENRTVWRLRTCLTNQSGTKTFNCGLWWLRRKTTSLLHTAKKKGPRIVIPKDLDLTPSKPVRSLRPQSALFESTITDVANQTFWKEGQAQNPTDTQPNPNPTVQSNATKASPANFHSQSLPTQHAMTFGSTSFPTLPKLHNRRIGVAQSLSNSALLNASNNTAHTATYPTNDADCVNIDQRAEARQRLEAMQSDLENLMRTRRGTRNQRVIVQSTTNTSGSQAFVLSNLDENSPSLTTLRSADTTSEARSITDADSFAAESITLDLQRTNALTNVLQGPVESEFSYTSDLHSESSSVPVGTAGPAGGELRDMRRPYDAPQPAHDETSYAHFDENANLGRSYSVRMGNNNTGMTMCGPVPIRNANLFSAAEFRFSNG